MIPPFKRPVRIDGGHLLSADGNLIMRIGDTTAAEIDFIVEAINGYLPQLAGKQRKFGRTQKKVLAMLKTQRYWHRHCIWRMFPSPSTMTIVMETLLERGLVSKTEFASVDAPGTMIDRYEITYEGEQCATD